MNKLTRAGRPLVALAAATALLTLAGSGAAAVGSLPGGTAISVEITSPAHNTVVPEGPVAVAGSASVGEGQPVANTLLVYVIDLSGSTGAPVATTLCGAQNFVAPANEIIDCEIAAAKALNNAAISLGTVAEIGAVGFGGQTSNVGNLSAAFALDLSPAPGIQNRIAPDADANANTTLDLDEALFRVADGGIIQLFTPANVGGFTNYWAAVHRAREIADASALPNKVVVFLSDGNSNAGGPSGQPVSDALAGIAGITFHTFAIGNSAQCSPTVANRGTLQQIADATGGTCTELDNPADAIGILPDVIGSTLDSVTVSVDGGPATAAATAPALPVTGPNAVTWSHTTGPLAPGTHELCATAGGADGGGAGDVTDCITITVNRPPSCGDVVASPDELWPPNGKLVRVTLSGGSDPDGDAVTLEITGIEQDEPASAGGDAALAGGDAVDLRAKRLGSGDGRVYEIAYTITDPHGATCTGTVIVGVPHDQSGAPAVDSGVRFDSLP